MYNMRRSAPLSLSWLSIGRVNGSDLLIKTLTGKNQLLPIKSLKRHLNYMITANERL